MYAIAALSKIVRKDARIEVKVPAVQGRKAYSYFREGSEEETRTARSRKVAGIGGAIALGGLAAAAIALRQGKRNNTTDKVSPIALMGAKPTSDTFNKAKSSVKAEDVAKAGLAGLAVVRLGQGTKYLYDRENKSTEDLYGAKLTANEAEALLKYQYEGLWHGAMNEYLGSGMSAKALKETEFYKEAHFMEKPFKEIEIKGMAKNMWSALEKIPPFEGGVVPTGGVDIDRMKALDIYDKKEDESYEDFFGRRTQIVQGIYGKQGRVRDKLFKEGEMGDRPLLRFREMNDVLFSSYKEGDEFVDRRICSTTTAKLGEMSGGGAGVTGLDYLFPPEGKAGLYKINYKKDGSTRARQIPNPAEGEVVFMPNTRFRVVKTYEEEIDPIERDYFTRRKKRMYKVVELEEI